MINERKIVEEVYAAKEDMDAADNLIKKYLPFIKSETAKFLKHPPAEGQDDELCIAMFAFHEVVINYDQKKGAFFYLASMAIRNRLIDYYRKEKKHQGTISIYQPENEEKEGTLLDSIESGKNEIEDMHITSSVNEELKLFSEELVEYGLSLTEIAENCPKQNRTLKACHEALGYARKNEAILETFISKKKLPISQLSEGCGVSHKTLERHRKYMVAILLAFTNGFEIIRDHLSQITPRKGGNHS